MLKLIKSAVIAALLFSTSASAGMLVSDRAAAPSHASGVMATGLLLSD